MLSNSNKSLRVVVGGIWRVAVFSHCTGLYFTFHGWLAQGDGGGGLFKKGTGQLNKKIKQSI